MIKEELREVKLYSQYQSNQFLIDYWKFHNKIMQISYTNLISYNLVSYQYLNGYILKMYAFYAYKITPPDGEVLAYQYDVGLKYDNGLEYDWVDTEITFNDDYFKSYIFSRIRKDLPESDLINLYKRISDILEVNPYSILIEEVSRQKFKVTIPNSKRARFFGKLVEKGLFDIGICNQITEVILV